MNDVGQLQRYIDVWRVMVAENVALLRQLDTTDWAKPTDLPGWNVRYIAAHLAHLESALAGNPQQQVDVPEAPHIKSPMSVFTESGPLARADWTTDQIIEEIESSAAKRADALHAMMPVDPTAPGDGFAAVVGWDWATLLSNRVLDQWMHQQDIRRAVDKPGGLAGPGGAHAMAVFSRSIPYIVGKRVAPPPGTTVVLDVSGEHRATLSAAVGQDGRAARLDEAPADPTARIGMDFETFIVLSGGRRMPDQVTATVTGDTAVGNAIVANLAVTP
ncbi:MAG TPA: maleylpyruvate isomerase N-terminal domain-containing protein [Aeromicrobium sp.]|nr:maleylpyruvate isomerase N-terminal domain-containing protein [Aeromicrobium sp.]